MKEKEEILHGSLSLPLPERQLPFLILIFIVFRDFSPVEKIIFKIPKVSLFKAGKCLGKLPLGGWGARTGSGPRLFQAGQSVPTLVP